MRIKKMITLALAAVLAAGCTGAQHTIVNQSDKDAAARQAVKEAANSKADSPTESDEGSQSEEQKQPSEEVAAEQPEPKEEDKVQDEEVTIETTAAPVTGIRKRTLEQELLDAVNEYRAENGVAPLYLDERLEDAALVRAAEAGWCWSHTRPDGSECWTAGPDCWIAENLARGQESVDAVMEAWKTSPGHNAQLLDPESTGFFPGILFFEDGGALWAAEFSV